MLQIQTRHILGENCPVVSPTLKDSGMSFPGQCDTPLANQTSVESEPHDELLLSGEPQDEPSTLWRKYLRRKIVERISLIRGRLLSRIQTICL